MKHIEHNIKTMCSLRYDIMLIIQHQELFMYFWLIFDVTPPVKINRDHFYLALYIFFKPTTNDKVYSTGTILCHNMPSNGNQCP